MAVWFSILRNTRNGIEALEDEDFKKVLCETARPHLTDPEMKKFQMIMDEAIKKFKRRTIKY